MKRGKIITIEGTDGSGKNTQTIFLVHKAHNEGYKTFTMSFPDYKSKWGQKVQQYKEGKFGNLQEVKAEDACWLYALDREEKKELFEIKLSDGYNIILDRYTESNLAHQGSKRRGEERAQIIRWIGNLENKILGIPPSDYVIFMDLPVEHSLKAIEERNRQNNNTKTDLHEQRGHLVAAYETYKELATRPDWTTIPCLKPSGERYAPEELAQIVWSIVQPKLVK